MIEGIVTDEYVPQIPMPIGGREWPAIVDSGFNGWLELPSRLKDHVDAVYRGPVESHLAGGQIIEEDSYVVRVPFEGESMWAEATFVEGDHILLGTRMMSRYRLDIDFPAQTVRLERRVNR